MATVTLNVYDTAGTLLTYSAFRNIQYGATTATNGQNDALLNPTDLSIQSQYILTNPSGSPTVAFTWTQSCTLSMSYSTASWGYHLLLVDFPASGTFDLLTVAAQQYMARLDALLAARSTYTPSSAFTTVYNAAKASITTATGSGGTTSSRGGAGATGFDQTIQAFMLHYKEWGIQYAVATRSTNRPQWAVTFDSISNYAANLQTVADMVDGDTQDGWLRIVMDSGVSASSYAPVVSSAHAKGLKVCMEIVDSQYMSKFTVSQFQSKVQAAVAALPTADCFECGNEVGGNWLGSNVMTKVNYATQYVKAHTSARTLVTLYYLIGDDAAQWSMFTWAKANLDSTALSTIDDIGISLYPAANVLGASLDRIFATLHVMFPSQRILITELDYWDKGASHYWWFVNNTDATGTARNGTADFYYRAILGYPYCGGGCYWWYYLEEALPKNSLWDTLHTAHRDASATPPPSPPPPVSLTQGLCLAPI